MAVYSLDKLIEETRRLAAEFRRTTGTMLPVSGEIARYDVSHHLELQLNNEQNASYDATGTGAREGQRVQIKGRVVGDTVKSSHRIGQFNTDSEWDLIIVSLMNDDFQPLEMYQATREEIIEALNPDSSRSKRGAISVAKFKIISELVWTSETGTDV